MLYREIIAVCSQIHTKHINTAVCGQNVELLNVKLVVHIVTTGLYSVNNKSAGDVLGRPDSCPLSAATVDEAACSRSMSPQDTQRSPIT